MVAFCQTQAAARVRAAALLAFLILLIVASAPLHAQQQAQLVLEEGISGAVWDVATGSAGTTVFSCGRDSTAKAWSTTTGEGRRIFRTDSATLVTCLALTADDRTLATGDMHGRVTVWNTETGAMIATIPAHTQYVQSLAFSRDGRLLYSAGRDDRISVWDAASGRIVRSTAAEQVWINDLALSHDGRLVATAGQDGTIKVFDAQTGTLLFSPGYHQRFAKSVAFSPDDATLVSSGRDARIRLWDVKRRALAGEFAIEGGYPRSLALQQGGDQMAVCLMDGLVQIWNWRKAQLVRTLPYSYGAMAASFDKGGKRLYTAHTDGSVKVWNAADGTQIVSMVGFNNGQWLTYTPDGYYDCSAFGDVYVKWRVDDILHPLEQYTAVYKQPAIIEDALSGTYVSAARIERVAVPPEVRITSPRNGQLFAFGSEPTDVILELRATDARRVERVALTLNGRQLRDDALAAPEVLERSDTALALRYRLPVLPGVNVIEAVAINAARVRSARRSAVVRVETQDRSAPNLFVLAVGIDEYAPAWPDLRFASLDARRLADALARQEGGMYTRVYTQVLTNREATRERVLAAIGGFPRMSRNDVLVMFFSGHGVRARAAKGEASYYFLTANVAKNKVPTSALRWDDLARAVQTMQAGRVILLLDACHSGAVSDGASNEKVAAALAGDLGIVFASSSGNEYSFENQSWGHGAFTKALLDALAGGADYTKDAVIDWNELQLFVSRAVQDMTGGGQHPMVPRLEQFIPFEIARVK
jgi:DNA-binding beta-propeller fold protein YncE